MHIRRLEVTDLLGRPGTIVADFNSDLNILTGKNGSGKTSVLKLLWYVLSGKILYALQEIPFSRVTLQTSLYEVTVIRMSRNTCKVEYLADGQKMLFEDQLDHDGDPFSNAEDEPNEILSGTGRSVFLPTFRRIEGGFTLGTSNSLSRISRAKGEVEEALNEFSARLTGKNHTFVASISTRDIVSLLLKNYADLSGRYADIQQRTTQEIIQKIKNFKSETIASAKIEEATTLIDEIRADVETMEARREEIMTPMEGVRQMVSILFQHAGIKIGSRLDLGDAASAVNSEALSAGEKQMLSFICYNAFYQDAIFIIDEPELSLHVDWQRQLFSILSRQNSSNQFVVATHSPFIYSKYPDKEISLNSDRGDVEVNA